MPSTVSESVPSSNYLDKGDIKHSPVPTQNKISEHDSEIPPTGKQKSKLLCFGRIFVKLKLEIVAFLFMFSYIMTRISSTSMILDKVCLVHFNYSPEICNNLENHTEIKISVERLSTNYQLGHTLIQTVPAVLLACFVGPWSDQYGRKFPAIIAILGMTAGTLGSAVCAYYMESRVEYYFIPAIFTGAFGGVVCLLAFFYSYASDVTPLIERTMKYAFIEMATGLSQPLGAAAGGWIYNFFGYPTVFLASTCGLVFSLIWITFMLPETRGENNKDPLKIKIRKLFTCKTFKESFIATTKKRPNQGRKQMLLLIISMCFLVIATNSTSDINYLYAHHQFSWGPTKYSTITAVYSIITIFVLILVVPAMKYFRTGDPTLGLVGTTSTLLKYIGIGVSWKPAIFHIANILGPLSPCATLAIRSRISKVVSSDDLGKLLLFSTILIMIT
ncbi:proton-coupled folate transporter [Trichonephila clavata]|uniref:Proton-coupled folate transporter n=1 Tax=Trichonephila clavata TaxID=2740835 RepID=A0A8X6GS10_TRICU|nr:proton-coupled folate transporter [Trichonephila clavata]